MVLLGSRGRVYVQCLSIWQTGRGGRVPVCNVHLSLYSTGRGGSVQIYPYYVQEGYMFCTYVFLICTGRREGVYMYNVHNK